MNMYHQQQLPSTRNLDTLRRHYRFILDDDDDDGEDCRSQEGWEMRMVRAYHARLFKEYCLADLSRAEEGGKVYT